MQPTGTDGGCDFDQAMTLLQLFASTLGGSPHPIPVAKMKELAAAFGPEALEVAAISKERLTALSALGNIPFTTGSPLAPAPQADLNTAASTSQPTAFTQRLCNRDWVCTHLQCILLGELKDTCRQMVDAGMLSFVVTGVSAVQALMLQPLQFQSSKKTPRKLVMHTVLSAVQLALLIKPMFELLEQLQAAQAPAAAASLQPHAAAAAGMDGPAPAAAYDAGQAAGPSTSSGLQQCDAAADMHDINTAAAAAGCDAATGGFTGLRTSTRPPQCSPIAAAGMQAVDWIAAAAADNNPIQDAGFISSSGLQETVADTAGVRSNPAAMAQHLGEAAGTNSSAGLQHSIAAEAASMRPSNPAATARHPREAAGSSSSTGPQHSVAADAPGMRTIKPAATAQHAGQAGGTSSSTGILHGVAADSPGMRAIHPAATARHAGQAAGTSSSTGLRQGFADFAASLDALGAAPGALRLAGFASAAKLLLAATQVFRAEALSSYPCSAVCMKEYELLRLSVAFTLDVLRVTDLTKHNFKKMGNLPVQDADSAATAQAAVGAEPQHTSSSSPCSIAWLYEKFSYLSSDEWQQMLSIITAAANDPEKGLRYVAEAAAALMTQLLCEPLVVPATRAAEAGDDLQDRVYNIVVLASTTMPIVRLLVRGTWPHDLITSPHPVAAAFLQHHQAAVAAAARATPLYDAALTAAIAACAGAARLSSAAALHRRRTMWPFLQDCMQHPHLPASCASQLAADSAAEFASVPSTAAAVESAGSAGAGSSNGSSSNGGIGGSSGGGSSTSGSGTAGINACQAGAACGPAVTAQPAAPANAEALAWSQTVSAQAPAPAQAEEAVDMAGADSGTQGEPFPSGRSNNLQQGLAQVAASLNALGAAPGTDFATAAAC
jgi:uncharacterized membrane protein YgcG